MFRRILIVPIGLLILAIGLAAIVGIFTQTAATEDVAATPGVLPIVLPPELFGFPTVAISGVIGLLGVAVIIIGWKFGY